MSNGPMSREMRKEIIMEDFRWLEEIEVHKIDGKLLLGDKELPYNIGHVFYEKEFVENWLMHFALGNYYGINYFNVESWCAMTNNGTRAVLIVNNDHKPVLLVPPLVAHKLNAQDFRLLRAASWHMHHNSADTQYGKDPNLNLSLAKKIISHMDETKRITYTQMILPEFYEKHGIIPEVEQAIYYIKDVIRARTPAKIEDISKTRILMYKHHKKEPLTKEEKAFIKEISMGQYLLEDHVAVEGKAEATQDQAPSNPMEC